MSRHRDIRGINRNLDDYYDDSEEDDYGMSPSSASVGSPSMKQFLYDRSKKSSLGSYLETPPPQAAAPDPLDEEWEIPQGSESIFELDDGPSPASFPSAIAGCLGQASPASAAGPSLALDHPPGSSEAFKFDTASRDDQILSAQKQAIQRKGGPAPSSSASSASSASFPISKPGTTKPIVKKVAKGVTGAAGAAGTSSPGSKKTGTEGSQVLRTSSSGRVQRSHKQRSAAQQRSYEKAVAEGQGKGKGHVNLVTIGHVDAGKSTLMGHLLFSVGVVDKKTMHRYERDARDTGKASFAFAWVMDAEGEERERGVTIDVSVNYMETERLRVTLLDAPGHQDFVPKMLTGTAQADVALLVIDSVPGEFESGFHSTGQTKEHSQLAHSLGITRVIVAVNKLDRVDHPQARFQEISSVLAPFLEGLRFEAVQFVPLSALRGDNLTARSADPSFGWYKGPTLLEAIDGIPAPRRPADKRFRLAIADTYKDIQMGGTTISGRIQTGNVAAGDTLLLMPLYEVCTIKTIHRNGVQAAAPFAAAGDNVDLAVTGLDPDVYFGAGSFLCDPESPIPVVTRFLAKIYTFDITRPIIGGHQAVIHASTNQEPVQIRQLLSLMDHTGKELRKKPRALGPRAFAMVEICTLERGICLEKFSDYKQLGRFLLRERGVSIAQGIVTDIIDQKTYF